MKRDLRLYDRSLDPCPGPVVNIVPPASCTMYSFSSPLPLGILLTPCSLRFA
jgi:hypothetical protein